MKRPGRSRVHDQLKVQRGTLSQRRCVGDVVTIDPQMLGANQVLVPWQICLARPHLTSSTFAVGGKTTMMEPTIGPPVTTQSQVMLSRRSRSAFARPADSASRFIVLATVCADHRCGWVGKKNSLPALVRACPGLKAEIFSS